MTICRMGARLPPGETCRCRGAARPACTLAGNNETPPTSRSGAGNEGGEDATTGDA
jgi:hypothetical protein